MRYIFVAVFTINVAVGSILVVDIAVAVMMLMLPWITICGL